MPVKKPRVFVGSSKESLEVVYALQELLQDDAEVVPWKHADFELSKTFIENIESELSRSDFGVFVFSGDDKVISRGEDKGAVRDNVLLEFGLFLGALGRNRTFIVCPSDYASTMKMPSDLLGITLATYNPSVSSLKTALGSSATALRTAITKNKKRAGRDQGDTRRIDGILSRGSTEFISMVADAALFVGDQRHEYSRELSRRLKAPPCQNTCRLNRTRNPGAMKEERIGTIRTGIQGPGSGPAVAA